MKSMIGFVWHELLKAVARLAWQVLVVLVILKGVGLLPWSWWWVVIPIWGPLAVLLPIECLILCWKACDPTQMGIRKW